MKQALIHTVVAGIASIGLVASAQAHDMETPPPGKEKCYGISKRGANDCSSANGSHSCGGMAEKDNDPNEWQFVAKGECDSLGGKKEAPLQPKKNIKAK